MQVDVLQIAHEYLKTLLRTHEQDMKLVEDAFNYAIEFKKEAMKRGIIKPEGCFKCGTELKIIDVSNAVSSQFRAGCECTQVSEKTEPEAIDKWIKEISK